MESEVCCHVLKGLPLVYIPSQSQAKSNLFGALCYFTRKVSSDTHTHTYLIPSCMTVLTVEWCHRQREGACRIRRRGQWH